MRDVLNRTIVVLLLMIVASYSLWEIGPPSLKDQQENLQSYSAHRAYSYLKHIAYEPHPTGSKGNERVREYIMKVSKDLGYEPEVQTAEVSVSEKNRNLITAATIHNVLVRVPGSTPSHAVLVMAHYDSEAGSPGANDDGVAVAAMLETLRALKEHEKLKNDVIFLFTDGEELGLFGARAFWKEHPWAKDVSMVLNYEARGSKGSSLMFETGANNGWLIENFSKAASHPVSNSSMSDFYELMTNDTDFTIAKEYGKTGLNFAYGDGRYAYHSPLDNLEHIDLKTVQHHGENVYNLVLQFGQADLSEPGQSDKVFFNLFGILIHYSTSWILPLNILVSALILSAVAWRVKARKLVLKQLGLAFLFIPTTLLILVGMLFGTWKLADVFWTDELFRYQPYTISFAHLLIGLSLFILLLRVMSRWVNLDHVYPAVLLMNLILIWGIYIYLPGASYLMIWPFFIHYVFYLGSLASKKALECFPIVHTASSVLILLFFTPLLFLLFVFLPIGFIPYIGAIGCSLVGFWILPSLNFVIKGGYRSVALGSFLLGLSILGYFQFIAKTNSELPERNNLFFVQHADQNESYWVTKTQPDSWTSMYLPTPIQKNLNDLIIFNGTKQMVWADQTNVNPRLHEPDIIVLKNEKHTDFRELELRIQSGRKAQDYLMMEVLNTKVLESEIQGQFPDDREAEEEIWNWRMRYYHVPVEGIRLKLKLEGTEPVSLRVMDGSYGLPIIEGLPQRPSKMVGRYEYDLMTLVVKTLIISD
ncbi:M20/M25/M40 family metallo-hydrolase [Ammoniphilus sp. CFH 90114]|uniref:M20/M25/M40 family metallo-hydrolase n=1 Tax=Ammoniphilus sp. CFH 90114 TaxID=2493665 RepID=UPI00100FFD4F|nr:M20/M25/M40 family metallo-hydrolase [Ammoniphilus sp. CFH 90114]RXT07017.1 M20/M25/M40 family metallo-hydrolase [Ammoniphilus sp. CFH 90114]